MKPDDYLAIILPVVLSAIGLIYLAIRIHHRLTGRILLKIASPCSKHWSEFQGDSQVRHCDLCKKDVYNICNLSKDQRRILLDKVGGGDNVCIYIEPPFYKKAGYFFFAAVMCILSFWELERRQYGHSGGIMTGAVLDESRFNNFGNEK